MSINRWRFLHFSPPDDAGCSWSQGRGRNTAGLILSYLNTVQFPFLSSWRSSSQLSLDLMAANRLWWCWDLLCAWCAQCASAELSLWTWSNKLKLNHHHQQQRSPSSVKHNHHRWSQYLLHYQATGPRNCESWSRIESLRCALCRVEGSAPFGEDQ